MMTGMRDGLVIKRNSINKLAFRNEGIVLLRQIDGSVRLAATFCSGALCFDDETACNEGGDIGDIKRSWRDIKLWRRVARRHLAKLDITRASYLSVKYHICNGG